MARDSTEKLENMINGSALIIFKEQSQNIVILPLMLYRSNLLNLQINDANIDEKRNSLLCEILNYKLLLVTYC
jgi:hypothetical protein